jgi:integrase
LNNFLLCSILNDIKLKRALFLQSFLDLMRYQNRDRRIQRQGIAARVPTGLRTREVIGAKWTEIDLQVKPGLFRSGLRWSEFIGATTEIGPELVGRHGVGAASKVKRQP